MRNIILAAVFVGGSICLCAADRSAAQNAGDRNKGAPSNSVKDDEARAARDVARLEKERKQINEKLNDSAARIQESEARLTAIEAQLEKLEEQETFVRGSLDQRHDEIGQLLGSLQRMGRNPPPVMITQRKDALKMVRSAMLLSSAFPGLRTRALDLSNRLDELVTVITRKREESERHQSEAARLTASRTQLAEQLATKDKLYAQRRKDLEDLRRAVARLARNADKVEDLIPSVDKKLEQVTSLGQHNEELAAQIIVPDATQRPSADATSGADGGLDPRGTFPGTDTPGIDTPGIDEPRVAILAPPEADSGNGRSLAGNPGRIAPMFPFREAKGKLPKPSTGQSVLAFGKMTKFGAPSKGIVLQTRHSAQITSPCDGWVVYAGEFRSYGQLLIINAGGGYHILLAGMSQIDVRPGDFILVGSPVGTMRPLVAGAQQPSRGKGPVLYVEFRKNGRPINPDPWWVSGPEKVQG